MAANIFMKRRTSDVTAPLGMSGLGWFVTCERGRVGSEAVTRHAPIMVN